MNNLHPEQRRTYMVNEESPRSKVFVSTINFKLVDPDSKVGWETMAFDDDPDVDDNKSILYLFSNCPLHSGYEFIPDCQIRGDNRDLQHEYAVELLKKHGYRVVHEEDDIIIREKTWNNLLEGTSADSRWNFKRCISIEDGFTPKQIRRIELLKYLKDKGKI